MRPRALPSIDAIVVAAMVGLAEGMSATHGSYWEGQGKAKTKWMEQHE